MLVLSWPPVAIIPISGNVIFIWETGYWTRAIKRFALFDLLKRLFCDTKILSKYIPSINGGLNQILKRLTFRFHYGSNCPAVTIAVLKAVPNPMKQMSKTILRHTLIAKYFWHFCWLPYLYAFSIYENPSSMIFSTETEYISTRSWYPASPAYGVYISQWIRYARASSNYSDFRKRHLHLRNRLLDQSY
jgi:hypothetical protein